MKFAIRVDDKHCWGCKACEVACKQEHRTPTGVKLIQVCEERPARTEEKPDFRFSVNLCRHCEEPPCAEACPAQAITKRDDGIVVLGRERCRGCGACVDACSYGAITMDRLNHQAWKCDMCVRRVANGLIPACADNICLAHCIYFGNARRIDSMMEEKAWLKHRLEGNLGSMVVQVED